jgi:Type III restriction enzyme, res subunit/Helicase C-terminal domain
MMKGLSCTKSTDGKSGVELPGSNQVLTRHVPKACVIGTFQLDDVTIQNLPVSLHVHHPWDLAMAFKLNRPPNATVASPEALFHDLRLKRVEGLLSHQADILRAYHGETLNAPDVALQLPTGSGKTLVGLLIGEWRRRHFQETVVYLCPTKQLVHQVVEQGLKKFGIRTHAFTGKQADYRPDIRADYLGAESVAVTTYSGLFNTNSFFEAPNVIILDDSHAAENYIVDYWSLTVTRKDHIELFNAVVSLLRQALSRVVYQRLCAPTNEMWDTEWVDKLPTPTLEPLIPELTALLDQHAALSNLKYSWSVIRDHLFACHVYLSTSAILIRPTLPPTMTHRPFAAAKQRVYMSATLGSGGDLERITGIEKIVRLPIPKGWDKQGIGRRFFLFPERSMTADDANNLVLEMMKTTPRTLMLVTSEGIAKAWRDTIENKIHFRCINAAEIESSKDGFVNSTSTVAVIANRYDGIDLIGDECRLLCVYDLPRSVNLQERFLMSPMAATVLLNDRIQTRIVQAVGRCTRSATDYAAVVVLGEKLSNFFLQKERRSFLHPEIQAELQFGIDQSRNMTSEGFLENLKLFLAQGDDWSAADGQIIALRESMTQKELPGTSKLIAAVGHEVKYQYAIWRGDYVEAVRQCEAVLGHLSGDEVKGYRAFWSYLAGSAAWLGSVNGIGYLDAVAREKFGRAAAATNGVLWLKGLSRLHAPDQPATDDEIHLASVVERLEEVLEGLGTANDRKFEAEIQVILDGLNHGDSSAFESSHERLGRLLGYEARNEETTAAPDPWWIASDKLCFVFEDHSPFEAANAIGANKVRQAASHRKWIKAKVPLHPDAEIIQVIISPRTKVDSDAVTYAEDVCYWNLEKFQSWATHAVSIIREVRGTFPGPGHVDWREQTMRTYKDGKIDPVAMRNMLSQSLLRDLDQTPPRKS